jgi:uncharacterized repeat protein (TIGR02543 family)
MKKHLALVLAVVSLITACDNSADAPREELARVRIGVVDTRGVVNTRSVLPTAPALESMERFALYGTARGGEENWLADFIYQNGGFYDNKGKPAVVYLRPGDWRFTLYAYPPENSPIAPLKGTATKTITAGFDEAINFALSFYGNGGNGDEGTGSVSLRIELPTGSGVASVETTIDGEPLDPALGVNAGAVIYENNETPAGQYLFSFVLKDSAGKTVLVVSDIVVVASDLASAKQYALTDEDFNGPPAPPSNFTATSYDAANHTLHFTWQDNSFNETGFRLSDGTTTRAIDAATQSFGFPVADPTASVTYTLRAINGFGESAPAQISGPLVFTVTFDRDDGSADVQTLQVTSGGPIGVNMPANPTRTDYTFDGWYTDRNGGGGAFTADTIIINNLTVYAKWMVLPQYTITFDLQGGNINGDATQQTRTANSGSALGVNIPSNPSKNGDTFDGWYTDGNGGGSAFTADTLVAGDLTVYAKWEITSMLSNLSLSEALTWLAINVAEGGAYTITVKGNETIAPQMLSYNGKNVGVTLEGRDVERTVSLSASGSLFTVGSGATLTLGNNVSLQGRSSNTASLVYVNSGGTLVMKTSSKISGNYNTSSSTSSIGGGVAVNGTFTMNGGEISGNSAERDGGGVRVSNGGTLTMSGGMISGNIAFSASSSYYSSGGGVFVDNGGTFTMSDGTISDNSTSWVGGGVYSYGTFTMSGGTISGNTASSSTYGGGGVLVENSSTFTMSGGTISGNTADRYGGGVYVYGSGAFTKQSGGIIYGSDAEDSLKNTAYSNSYGHAVYINSGSKKRNSTAGVGVTLNSGVSGSSGGWE